MPSIPEMHLRFVDRLMSFGVFPDKAKQERARITTGILFYSALVATVMVLVRIVGDGFTTSTLSLIFTAPLLWLGLLSIRLWKNIRLSADFFVVSVLIILSGLLVTDNGLASRVLVWFPVLAMLGNFLNGYLIRWRLTTLQLLILCSAIAGHKLDWFATPQWAEGSIVGRGIATILSVMLASVISAFYDEARNRADRARDELEQLRTEWVSVVSHELRTPLTAIKGSLQLLEANAKREFSDEQVTLFEIACRNSEHLSELLNDLLDMEQISSGRFDLKKEEVDLGQLVGQAVESFSPIARIKEVKLNIELDEELHCNADKHRVLQVLHNLLSNALKFSPEQGVVDIFAESRKEEIWISVVDDGPGISPHNEARLFSRFFQEDSSDTRRMGGSGLGLFISKSIIDLHGGTLTYAKEPGRGSRFTFVLPTASIEPL